MTRICNLNDVERVSAEIMAAYLQKFGKRSEMPESININDFVVNYLGCTLIYENIYEKDCLGYLSNGTRPLKISRMGEIRKIIFPKDAIVLDKYLLGPGQEAKRRFTLAHEAGHLVTFRINERPNSVACYHEQNGIVALSKNELLDRYNLQELFANRFAACFLMPADLVRQYVKLYFNCNNVTLDEYGKIRTYDMALIRKIAERMKVSISALTIRLEELDLYAPYSTRNSS